MSDDGGFDLSGLFAQAQAMQEQLVEAQEESASTTVEGQSGGGAVKITCAGNLEFQSISIARDAVDPADVEMLEDLVLAAVRDTIAKVNALNAELLGPLGSFGSLGSSGSIGELGGPP
jgi:DNA-binding YbaB/EbfC family protein